VVVVTGEHYKFVFALALDHAHHIREWQFFYFIRKFHFILLWGCLIGEHVYLAGTGTYLFFHAASRKVASIVGESFGMAGVNKHNRILLFCICLSESSSEVLTLRY